MILGSDEKLVDKTRDLYVSRNDTFKARSELMSTKYQLLLMYLADTAAKLFATTSSETDLP